eukprot:618080-Ditylum_brightwellii.AAC.2
MIEKKRRKQTNLEKRRMHAKNNLDKMYEENRKVIKDAAAKKTYSSASVMIRDDGVMRATAPIKKQTYCNNTNCNR